MRKESMALISALFVSLFFLQLFAAEESEDKVNIAVLALESRGGLSQSEIGTLTDRLRSMLVRTHAFNVVDRGKMSEILDEQGFQMSGCTSTECAVEAGKVLGVEQMVSGTIGRIGKMYTIDIILIDVTTSKIIKSLTRDYTGEIEGLVAQMKSIADELAGRQGTQKTASGAYTVSSSPSGAAIFIDGEEVGVTPKKIKDIPVGAHVLKIEKEGYTSVEGKIIIEAGKTKKYKGNLKKAKRLVVNTAPSGAEVYVDDKYIGNTPLQYPLEEGKTVMVVIKKAGYKTWRNRIEMDDDQYLKMNMQSGSGLAQAEYKENEEGGSSALWWILGGAAVVGGGAAYFLSQPAEDTPENTVSEFPAPPSRPQ
jgi:TolB-like protein